MSILREVTIDDIKPFLNERCLLYGGKTKKFYLIPPKDPNFRRYHVSIEQPLTVMEYTDTITAGDGKRMEEKRGLGTLRAGINDAFMTALRKELDVAHIGLIADETGENTNYSLERLGYPLGLEVIGYKKLGENASVLKKFPGLGLKAGQVFSQQYPTRIDYKNDEMGDPTIDESFLIASGFLTKREVDLLRNGVRTVIDVGNNLLASHEVTVDDAKVEYVKLLPLSHELMAIIDTKEETIYDFAKRNSREMLFDRTQWKVADIRLADTVDLDSIRARKGGVSLDKDLFRKNKGDVVAAYKEVYDMLCK